ncbi:MAG TPA: Gfo/Idh/MocA family oxidoreductase [Planctomycetota bacterium]|jgi:predicted dehydrogenase
MKTPPSRRDLVKGAAAVLATAIAAEVKGAEEAPAPKRIRIGFLGATHSHGLEKIKTVLASAEWELVGVCDESARIGEAVEKLGAKRLSQADLLAGCEVVAVESDVKDHARHATLALEAGKHVHLEKPPADTTEGLTKLVALAKERKLLLQHGYMWRFNPGINAVLEAARQGWLGEIYLVRGTINTSIGAGARPQWAQFRGGSMFELGGHLVDPLIRLMGKPEKITPVLKKHADLPDSLADDTLAIFEFPRAIGTVSSATVQPNAGAHRSFEVLGTNGSALVRPIENPVLTVELAKAAGPYQAGAQTIKLPPYRRYTPELAELAQCIRSGKPLGVTPEEDLLVHEALIRASGMA